MKMLTEEIPVAQFGISGGQWHILSPTSLMTHVASSGQGSVRHRLSYWQVGPTI